jgi:hypothetical protein
MLCMPQTSSPTYSLRRWKRTYNAQMQAIDSKLAGIVVPHQGEVAEEHTESKPTGLAPSLRARAQLSHAEGPLAHAEGYLIREVLEPTRGVQNEEPVGQRFATPSLGATMCMKLYL